MYKDPDRQKEANRIASERRRERINKECKGMTANLKETLDNVIPKQFSPAFLGYQRHTFACQTGSRVKLKCFGDLPADVQETIAMMSRHDGKIDPIVKANRTAIAVNYQHQFPDRFHSTGAN